MLSQLAANALIAASIYALVGSGFSLIYSPTRCFHFAHGIVFTASAYFMFVLAIWAGLPIVLAALLAVMLGGALGVLMELCIYRPLRIKSAPPVVLLLASLGIYVVLQNVISMVFGDGSRIVRSWSIEKGIGLLGARVTPVQVLTILLGATLLSGLAILMRTTKWGKTTRAVVSDEELARVSGIGSGTVIAGAFALGSALASIAGVLMALDVDMTPTMGLNALMMGIVAAIVGGIRSIPGVALGAVLLAIAEQVTTWAIGSQWQETFAFVILIAFMLFRPQGFFGAKLRTTTV